MSMLLVCRQNSDYTENFYFPCSLSFFFWKGGFVVKISQILNNNVAVVKKGGSELIVFSISSSPMDWPAFFLNEMPLE